MENSFYSLHIHHKHGDDVTIFSSREKAMRYLHAYVEQWIETDFPDRIFESHAGSNERIDEYMELTDEYANIEHVSLDPKYKGHDV